MGTTKSSPRVKLIAGLLTADSDLLPRAAKLLARAYGPIDERSAVLPFDFTDYYAAEFGAPLFRQFVAFETLTPPDSLADIKCNTNRIEQRLAEDCGSLERRVVNIDPGVVALGKLVLATTKDQAHRVYLQRGIYAEVTLFYRDGRWQGWPWTYPDYASPAYHPFLNAVRERLKAQMVA